MLTSLEVNDEFDEEHDDDRDEELDDDRDEELEELAGDLVDDSEVWDDVDKSTK